MQAAVFIAALIGAIRGIKLALPEKVTGLVTVLVAVGLGVAVALLDVKIGLADISVSEGVAAALAAAGVANVAEKV